MNQVVILPISGNLVLELEMSKESGPRTLSSVHGAVCAPG